MTQETTPATKNIILSTVVVQATLDYLTTRPYSEVARLIQDLVNSANAPENAQDVPK